jgi:hypothetical protein
MSDIATKMRNLLDEKTRRARDGIDLNSDKKGYDPWLVHRSHEMAPDVFDVGIQLHDRSSRFDYKAWIHWMTDAEIHRTTDGVVIHHRSEFFCQHAARHFLETLKEFFGVPVRFRASYAIKDRVEA